MNIETIIFIYIYICICMALFDLLFVGYTKYTQKAIPRMERKMELLLYTCNDRPSQKKKLYSKLRSLNNLIAYSRLLTDPDKHRQVDRWTLKNATMLQDLTRFYCRSSSEKRAFWAYLLSRTDLEKIAKQSKEDARCVRDISKQLILLIKDPSIYVRENAFKAVLRTNSCKYVLEVLLELNENPSRLNEKLISDNLLSFAGEHCQLAQGLWENFPQLDSVLQVAFVIYMRMIGEKKVPQEQYYEGFFRLLESRSTDKEVRLALIRYFHTHTYQPVYPLLVSFVSSSNELMWSYAAVSATTLTAYPGQETLQILETALSSHNWYLRSNAADSLLMLDADFKLSEECKDPYAREMLSYRKRIRQQKKEAKVTND